MKVAVTARTSRSLRVGRGWLIVTLAALAWGVVALIGLGLWPLIVWVLA